MTHFKQLNTKKYQKANVTVTPDTVYWKRLSVPTLVKEFGAIDYVDFNPIEPHYFAVTCSVRVQIYNPITKLVVRNLSRFQETAYGGTFRQDGRLLVAGDEQGLVKLFDTSSKSVLRMFKGHKAAVHRAKFTAGKLHIASFSDDKSVKVWDISTEKTLHSYAEHTDYVRAGVVSSVSQDILVSGGYDGQIKLYDTRMKTASYSVDHGSPVESLLFLPTGGIFLSAGGTEICVWDTFAGCRLLAKISQHHKTVTSLCIGSNGKRILSAGLDRHVKIYDVASYQPVHTLDFPNAVLSLGVAPNDQFVVAGMVDGLVSIQSMETDRTKEKELQQLQRQNARRQFKAPVDHEIVNRKNAHLANYEHHLRKYEYVKCLKAVLQAKCPPEITVTVMQELIHRKGLERALVGNNYNVLERVLVFVRRHIGQRRFTRVLIDVTGILLNAYADRMDKLPLNVAKLFANLSLELQSEIQLTCNLLELQGMMELLINSSRAATEVDEMVHFVQDEKLNLLTPSAAAKEAAIVTV